MIETDSPYQLYIDSLKSIIPPTEKIIIKKNNKSLENSNEPKFLKYFIPFLAKIKSLDPLTFSEILLKNSLKAFRI